jgi:hypothetical protein
VAVLALLIFAMPAQAAAVPITGPWWAQAAVDKMRVPVAPAQTVLLAPCPGYDAAGCNLPTPDSPIYIDPQTNLGEVGAMRVVLYRELGGRFDTLAMYPFALAHFARILHRRVAGTALTPATPAWDALAEVFEDAYSDCARAVKPPRRFGYSDAWDDSSGYDPTQRQHARICRLIRRVGTQARFATPR